MPPAVPFSSLRKRVWGALFVGALSAIGELVHRGVFHNIPHGPPWLLPALGLLWGAILGPVSALLGSWWRLPFALAAAFGVGKGVPIATSGVALFVPGMSEEESLRILLLAHVLLGAWLGVSVRLLVAGPRLFRRKPPAFVGPPMYPSCDDCGMSPVHPLLLRPDYNALRAKPLQFCCSRCRRKRMRARWRDEWLILTGFSVLAILAVIFYPRNPSSWLILNLYVALVLLVPQLLAHELGHALAAWLLRLRVFRIYVGQGLTIYKDSRWGLFRERDLPTGMGLTILGYPSPHWFKLRSFLVTLAGPMVQVLTIVVLMAAVGQAELWEQVLDCNAAVYPAVAVVVGAGMMLVASLLPWTSRVGNEEFASDGKQLLRLPFLPREEAANHHALYFIYEAEEAGRRKDHRAARRWLERCRELYPEHPLGRLCSCTLLLRDGCIEESRRAWKALAAEEKVAPIVQVYALDGQATCDLLLLLDGRRTLEEDGTVIDLVDETRRLMDTAFGRLNEARGLLVSMLATVAALRVEEGDLDEAERILLEIWDQMDHPGHTAFGHCYLSLVAGLRGEFASARHHLEQAREDDPESPVVTGTARRLESLATATGPADEPAPVVASPSV